MSKRIRGGSPVPIRAMEIREGAPWLGVPLPGGPVGWVRANLVTLVGVTIHPAGTTRRPPASEAESTSLVDKSNSARRIPPPPCCQGSLPTPPLPCLAFALPSHRFGPSALTFNLPHGILSPGTANPCLLAHAPPHGPKCIRSPSSHSPPTRAPPVCLTNYIITNIISLS